MYAKQKIRIGRTLPPAASPISLFGILHAFSTCFPINSLDKQFEQEICQFFEEKYCFLLSSGKAALTVTLEALKQTYPGRDQVVLPAYTCYSVPSAVKRAGLKVRLCDLAPSSFDFNKEKLYEIIGNDKLNRKILCVLPTHLFGCPADVLGTREVIGFDIPIVEDAAQAFGEICNGNKLGTQGDVGIFSLGRGKALSTMGGGIIVTHRKDLAIKIKSSTFFMPGYNAVDIIASAARSFLMTLLQNPSLFWIPKALPFLKLGETLWEPDFPLKKLSPFNIKLAKDWQGRLTRHQKARRKNCSYWKMNLPRGLTPICCETDISMIRFPVLMQTRKQRDFALSESERIGLGLMPSYPTPIHMIAQIASDFSSQRFPQAEDVCNRLLTLPVNEFVKPEDNEKIHSLLASCQ